MGSQELKKSCNTYDLPKEVLKKIGTMEAYTSKEPVAGPSSSIPVTEESEEEENDIIISLNLLSVSVFLITKC